MNRNSENSSIRYGDVCGNMYGENVHPLRVNIDLLFDLRLADLVSRGHKIVDWLSCLGGRPAPSWRREMRSVGHRSSLQH